MYLDLAKGTLFRTLLGTFSEGVFAVHSEFSAVNKTDIMIKFNFNIKPYSNLSQNLSNGILCFFTVRKVHCLLPWPTTNLDVVPEKGWKICGKLLPTHNSYLFLQYTGWKKVIVDESTSLY